MWIRKANREDWQEILTIYTRAREYMRQTGNPNQWRTTAPSPQLLSEDIQAGNLYIVTDDVCIHGVFALIPGPDPTYAQIDGAWCNDEPYGVIHRVASAGKRRGILETCLKYCRAQYSNLRIDTHHENRIMQHLLEKHGFIRCGIIQLTNGEPRIAYQSTEKGS